MAIVQLHVRRFSSTYNPEGMSTQEAVKAIKTRQRAAADGQPIVFGLPLKRLELHRELRTKLDPKRPRSYPETLNGGVHWALVKR